MDQSAPPTPAYTIETALAEATAELASAPLATPEAEGATPAAPAPEAETKPVAVAEDLDAPLSPGAKAARHEAKLRKERQALDAERKTHAEDLAFAKRLREAKTSGKRLEALRELFSDDELADVYSNELTQHFVSREPETPESKLEKLLDEKLTAKQKAEADEATAATTRLREEKQAEYMGAAYTLLDKEADKYPAVVRGFATRKVTEQDVFLFVDRFYAANKRGPYPAEVFDAFERHLSPSKTTATPAQQTSAGKTITGDMRSGASTTGAPKKSLDEAFEDELKDAGIL